jgi:translation initiation factor 2B subunit (eIF-2B alpha/beta/delta family)
VTGWVDWPSYRRLESLVRSPDGGAAEVGSVAASSMAEFVDRLIRYDPGAYPDAVAAVATRIAAGQPAFAPLVLLANTMFLTLDRGPEVAIAEARAFEKRLAVSTEIVSSVGAALIPEGASVLTHGGSSTVRATLVAASDREVRVVCTSSTPLGEGRRLAADLLAAGVAVEIIPEDAVADALYAVDLILLGANALGPESVVNVAGTGVITKEARNLGVRTLVLASADKALPEALFERAARVATASATLELVSLASIDSVVTEQGVLDTLAVARLTETKPVAPQLSA